MLPPNRSQLHSFQEGSPKIYIAFALTLFASEAGRLAAAFGILLYAWTQRIEYRGQKVPFWLGGMLFGPPVTLAFIGAVALVMQWLGLL